jgi:hypothetical protein
MEQTVYLQDKCYSFSNLEGKTLSLEDFFSEKTKLFIDKKNSGLSIKDCFKSLISESIFTIRGYSFIELLQNSEGILNYKGHEVNFIKEDGSEVLLKSCKNSLFMMNDKKVENSFFDSLIKTQKEELIEEEEKEDLNENELSDEEKQLDIQKETLFDKDIKPLLENGYSLHIHEDYRFLFKKGSIPILCRIINEEHYEEYVFHSKVDEKTFEFLDIDNKKITFELD